MEATWIPHGMISLFSDALLKFSLRCFQLERHIHLRAPAEVIENEEKLIEEVHRQFLPGDEDKVAVLRY